MISLAIATGIAPSVWIEEGEVAITTALELLEQEQGNAGGKRKTVLASG